MSIGSSMARRWFRWYPRRDSNPRTRLRRPVLYPLSYGGSTPSTISLSAPRQQVERASRIFKMGAGGANG